MYILISFFIPTHLRLLFQHYELKTSEDVVLGFWTRGHKIEGAEETTELWWRSECIYIVLTSAYTSFIYGLFQILKQIKVKNVHPVSDAGIQTHDLLIMSLLLKPLDKGSRPFNVFWLVGEFFWKNWKFDWKTLDVGALFWTLPFWHQRIELHKHNS